MFPSVFSLSLSWSLTNPCKRLPFISSPEFCFSTFSLARSRSRRRVKSALFYVCARAHTLSSLSVRAFNPSLSLPSPERCKRRLDLVRDPLSELLRDFWKKERKGKLCFLSLSLSLFCENKKEHFRGIKKSVLISLSLSESLAIFSLSLSVARAIQTGCVSVVCISDVCFFFVLSDAEAKKITETLKLSRQKLVFRIRIDLRKKHDRAINVQTRPLIYSNARATRIYSPKRVHARRARRFFKK